MSDIIKTAIIAGVVHKVLSEKEKSEKNENNIMYSSSQRTESQNQTLYIISGVISMVSGIILLICSISSEIYTPSIIISILLILLSILSIKRANKTT